MRNAYPLLAQRLGLKHLLQKQLDRFYPGSGPLWQDLIHILLLVNIQHAVVGQLDGDAMLVNFSGAWLMACGVVRPIGSLLVLCLITGLILETYQTVPAGSYIATYWVALSTLYLLRRNLSWRHATTWISTCLLAEVWLISFRTFALWLDHGLHFVTAQYVARQLAQVAIAAVLGFLAYNLWLRHGPIEADT